MWLMHSWRNLIFKNHLGKLSEELLKNVPRFLLPYKQLCPNNVNGQDSMYQGFLQGTWVKCPPKMKEIFKISSILPQNFQMSLDYCCLKYWVYSILNSICTHHIRKAGTFLLFRQTNHCSTLTNQDYQSYQSNSSHYGANKNDSDRNIPLNISLRNNSHPGIPSTHTRIQMRSRHL